MATPEDADIITALARELAQERQPEIVQQRIVDSAAREIDGAQFAGITLLTRRGAVTPVRSDPIVGRVDRAQYETNEGPCLDAAHERGAILVCDLANDCRWPRFARAAVE